METKKSKRIISLELVRIFSCVCVLICHFNASVCGWNNGLIYPENQILPSFYFGLYSGSIGVSLFFMLSGIGLMLSYRPNNLKQYYKKRILAIFPLFYIAWFFAFSYDFFRFKSVGGGAHPLWILSTVFGMDGYLLTMDVSRAGAYYKVGDWFLGCIILIYLVFPFIYYCVQKRPLLTFALSILLSYPFMNGVPIAGLYINESSFFVRIAEIIMGMFFVKYNLRERKKLLIAISSSCVLISILLKKYIPPFIVNVTSCMMLFAVLVCIGEKISNEKVQRLLIKASALTYPIFLIHHWFSDRMVVGLDLANLPHWNIALVCFIFVVWLIILSNLLVKTKNKIFQFAYSFW